MERASIFAGRARRQAGQVLAPAVGLSVLLSVLAVGCVHRPVLLVVGVLPVAAAAASLASAPRSLKTLALPAALFFALSGFSLLQSIPLPGAIVSLVSPGATDVWSRALAPQGEVGRAWVPVSLDPGATVIEAWKWFVYGCVFLGSAIVAARRGAAWGATLVFAAGGAAALTTIVHGLAGATKVFGLYQPRFAAAPWHVGPLLNPNNLCGYLNLAALCGAGLLLTRRPVVPRWVCALGVAAIIGVAATSASRAGIVSLAVGLVALAVLAIRASANDRRGARPRALGWLLGSSVLGGSIFALLGGTTAVWQELYDRDLSKLAMAQWARPMIGQFPWLGVGRGAFESAFQAYRTGPGYTVFAHAESFPAQWIAEWGVPIGIATLAAVVYFFRPSALGVRRDLVAAGIWCGAAALALQNLVDLAFEVPGVAIAVTAALGTAWGARRARETPNAATVRAHPESRLGAAWPVVGAGLLLMGMAWRHAWTDVATERRALHERYGDGAWIKSADERAAFRRDLRAAMLRHPAEPYFPLLGALIAAGTKDDNPMPWVARALERGPDNARTHLLLADVLAARGHVEQALMQLRLAVERDDGLARGASTRARRWARSPEQRLAAVPEGMSGAYVLEGLASESVGDERRGYLADALRRAPKRLTLHTAVAEDLIAELSRGDRSAACGGSLRLGCLESAHRHVEFLEANAPETSCGYRLRARLLSMDGRSRDAERLLAERCAQVSDRADCLYARVIAASESEPPLRFGEAAKDYLASRCFAAADCADALVRVGDLAAAKGDWGTAFVYFRRAVREAPTEIRWLRLADAAGRVGAHAQALQALESVAKLRGSADDALRLRIDQERAAASGLVGQ